MPMLITLHYTVINAVRLTPIPSLGFYSIQTSSHHKNAQSSSLLLLWRSYPCWTHLESHKNWEIRIDIYLIVFILMSLGSLNKQGFLLHLDFITLSKLKWNYFVQITDVTDLQYRIVNFLYWLVIDGPVQKTDCDSMTTRYMETRSLTRLIGTNRLGIKAKAIGLDFWFPFFDQCFTYSVWVSQADNRFPLKWVISFLVKSIGEMLHCVIYHTN